MADISTQLNTIENNAYGEVVLSAISSALTDVNPGVNITSELYTITNGRYGNDIRMAIHDALYKISEGSESGTGFIIDMYRRCAIGPINGIIGIGEYQPTIITGETIACREEYFLSGVIDWQVDYRQYATITDEERVGAITHILYNGTYYTSAMLFSPSSTAVAYSYNASPLGIITKDNTIWYYSDTDYAMPGQLDDILGNLTTYPTLLHKDNNGFVQSELLELLSYARASAVTV